MLHNCKNIMFYLHITQAVIIQCVYSWSGIYMYCKNFQCFSICSITVCDTLPGPGLITHAVGVKMVNSSPFPLHIFNIKSLIIYKHALYTKNIFYYIQCPFLIRNVMENAKIPIKRLTFVYIHDASLV